MSIVAGASQRPGPNFDWKVSSQATVHPCASTRSMTAEAVAWHSARYRAAPWALRRGTPCHEKTTRSTPSRETSSRIRPACQST